MVFLIKFEDFSYFLHMQKIREIEINSKRENKTIKIIQKKKTDRNPFFSSVLCL
jgi:CRISPR/Cas system-associated exonuclease Cas4 (RecB family)